MNPTLKAGQQLVEAELNHHGVLGMKWGVRKDRPGSTQSSLVEVGKNFLTHHGVLGMKWGFRKTSEVPSPRAADATSIVPHDKLGKTKIQTKGGENHPAHQDAVRVALAQQKLSKSGVHALSNKELQDVASRMNLEGQVHALNSKRPKSLGQRFIAEQANQAQKDPAAYLEKVNKGVEAVRKLKKAAA
jgi:hypothetical protein